MADVIQQGVVYGLPDVPHWPLHVAGGDDLVSPWRVLVGSQYSDLSPGHFLLVDVHSLFTRAHKEEKVRDQITSTLTQGGPENLEIVSEGLMRIGT